MSTRKSYQDKSLVPTTPDNPYREGTQSYATFKKVKARPGQTFADYVKKGARANTLRDAIRRRYIKAKK